VGSLLKNQHPHCPGEDGPRTEHCAGVSELFGGRDGGVQGAAASEPGAAPRLLRAAVEDVLAHGLPGLVPVAGCGAAGVVAVEWLVRARHSAGRRVWQLRARRCQSDPARRLVHAAVVPAIPKLLRATRAASSCLAACHFHPVFTLIN
jgi:hypothetical protein